MRGRILFVTMLLAAVLTGCVLATKAPPIANAGSDVRVRVGETVFYDGSKSYDPDGGEIVYYQWQITAAPEGLEAEIGVVIREGEDEATWTTASPLGEEDLGQWVIELKVTDDEGRSATDDMTLTVVR